MPSRFPHRPPGAIRAGFAGWNPRTGKGAQRLLVFLARPTPTPERSYIYTEGGARRSAQWETNQPPSLEQVTSELGRIIENSAR